MSTRASTRRAPIPRVSPGVPAVPVASRSLTWKIFTAPSAGRYAFSVAIPSGRGCSRSSRRAAASWCRFSRAVGVDDDHRLPGDVPQFAGGQVTGAGQHQVLQVLGLFRGQRCAVLGDHPGLRPVQHPVSPTRPGWARGPRSWCRPPRPGCRRCGTGSATRRRPPRRPATRAASATKCATWSGSSSPVMQFFRASTAASRIGSPATNGTANADSNRICVGGEQRQRLLRRPRSRPPAPARSSRGVGAGQRQQRRRIGRCLGQAGPVGVVGGGVHDGRVLGHLIPPPEVDTAGRMFV